MSGRRYRAALAPTEENIQRLARVMITVECCAGCADDPGNVDAHRDIVLAVLASLREAVETPMEGRTK